MSPVALGAWVLGLVFLVPYFVRGQEDRVLLQIHRLGGNVSEDGTRVIAGAAEFQALVELVEQLPKVVHLDVGSTQVQDVQPIENLTQLQILDLWGTRVQDITPVENLPNLETLRLPGHLAGKNSQR